MEELFVVEQKHIPEKAFCNRADIVCVHLRGVWSVGPYAFSSCPNLREVVCDAGPAVICEHAFDSCPNLSQLRFSSSLRTIGEYAFFNAALADIRFPDGLSLIGNSAFQKCDQLKALDFPSSLKEIGASAFSDCSVLQRIDLSSVAVLHDGCFANTAIEQIRFPRSLSYIGRDAFSNCGRLKLIVFDSPEIRMRGTSFVRCERLTHAVYMHRAKEEHRVLERPLTQTEMTMSLDRFDRMVSQPVTALFRLSFPFGLTDPVRQRCIALVQEDPENCLRHYEQIRELLTEGQREQILRVLEPLLISFHGGN